MKKLTLADWERKNKTHAIPDEFLALRFLDMSEKDFEDFVSKVRDARAGVKNKKEAVDFAKTLSKDVLIPLLINSATKK